MRTLDIDTMPVSEFSQNFRFVSDREEKEGVLIDPGGNPEGIIRLIESKGAVPKAIWLTHSHLDHAGAVAVLKKKYNVPLYASPIEKQMRQKMPEIAQMYGLSPNLYSLCPEPEIELKGGETIKVGTFEFEVMFTPGHSPGHMCFYCKEMNSLIAGDLVFQGSVGRTDLPGGDPKVLMQSISEHILPLPDETEIFPGHGDNTTVGEERNSNPYFPRSR